MSWPRCGPAVCSTLPLLCALPLTDMSHRNKPERNKKKIYWSDCWSRKKMPLGFQTSLPPSVTCDYTSHCWPNKEMERRERLCYLRCFPSLSITPLESQMASFIPTNAIINYFNRHAHCLIFNAIYIWKNKKKPARIYMHASQLANANHLLRRTDLLVPPFAKKKKRWREMEWPRLHSGHLPAHCGCVPASAYRLHW